MPSVSRFYYYILQYIFVISVFNKPPGRLQLFNMIAKILKKSLHLMIRSVNYPTLRCIALKSDQKYQIHATSNSEKPHFDSTTKQSDKAQINWKFWKFVGITSFCACIGFIIQYKGRYFSNLYKNQIIHKYSVIEEDQSYIDSPMYDEMKRCILFMPFGGRKIKLIAGCPGIGKTTATKKILQQLKQKGEEVYYFSFSTKSQSSQQDKNMLIKQFYTLMPGLVSKFKGLERYKRKKVKVVIDDINKIQENSGFQQIMAYLYTAANTEEIDIHCISSSSGFIQRQIEGPYWSSYYQKYGKILIIQDSIKNQQFIQFHKKVLYQTSSGKIKKVMKEGKQHDNPIIVTLANMKVTTRKVVRLLQIIIDMNIQADQQKALKYISQQIEDQSNQRKPNQIKSIIKNENKDEMRTLLDLILNVKEELKLNTCQSIKSKMSVSIEEVLDLFQRKNLLVFCRPRTVLELKAFRKVKQGLQNQKTSK